jgi:hypothetical protein
MQQVTRTEPFSRIALASKAAVCALALALPSLTSCSESKSAADVGLSKIDLENALVIPDASKLGLKLASVRLAEPAVGLDYAVMTPEEFARALVTGREAASNACLVQAFGTSDKFELRELLRSGGGGSPGSLDPEAAFAAWGVYMECMEAKGYPTSELGVLTNN